MVTLKGWYFKEGDIIILLKKVGVRRREEP